jgi:hypothetical protein
MVDTGDLKSLDRKVVRVQVPPRARFYFGLWTVLFKLRTS